MVSFTLENFLSHACHTVPFIKVPFIKFLKNDPASLCFIQKIPTLNFERSFLSYANFWFRYVYFQDPFHFLHANSCVWSEIKVKTHLSIRISSLLGIAC